jgi:hypothetical protein
MAKIKHLYWKLFVFWLKENRWTIHNLAYFALGYYVGACFGRGRWLIGPRIVNIVGLTYFVGVYCYSLLYLLWWKLTGKED